ncbi:MAG TPA: flavodoxin family protein [Bacillota bacterium]|nr:flavodoxin family protein [Bacillota bacterium]
MKTLIIYTSYHHSNTEKIALAMAKVLGADTMKSEDFKKGKISKYDTIGIGSGIYGGKIKKDLAEIMDSVNWENKNVFVFSTSGWGNIKYNDSMIELLEKKKAKIIGNFACKGFDTFAILKLFGGIAKGHPNAEDIKNAQNFAQELIKG